VKPALVISDRDNVATALEALEAGRVLDVAGRHVAVLERIAPGHKIALVPIASGQPIVKYGSPIGVATADIAAGAHVHTHNVASGRGRGDLSTPIAPEPGVRLAEPEDDAVVPADVPTRGGSHE
jgi:altronate hydrolase